MKKKQLISHLTSEQQHALHLTTQLPNLTRFLKHQQKKKRSKLIFPGLKFLPCPSGKKEILQSLKVTRNNQMCREHRRLPQWKNKVLADIIAPSCLPPTPPHIMFLLIHAARCDGHVALTSLLLFPLTCSQTFACVHTNTLFWVRRQRANELAASVIDHLNN